MEREGDAVSQGMPGRVTEIPGWEHLEWRHDPKSVAPTFPAILRDRTASERNLDDWIVEPCRLGLEIQSRGADRGNGSGSKSGSRNCVESFTPARPIGALVF